MLIEIFRVLFLTAIILQYLENISINLKLGLPKSFNRTLYFCLFFALTSIAVKSWLPMTALIICHFIFYSKFRRNINGASDSLTTIVLTCLWLSTLSKNLAVASMYYIAIQVLVSYFIAGLVKVKQPSWRDGSTLDHFMSLEKYAVSPSAKSLLSGRQWMVFIAAWSVIIFELSIPAAFFFPSIFKVFLILGAFFHLANYFFFGINRFFWLWVSTYPLLYHLSISN